jgi:tetratricopeptide (TPR) repeat protein
MAQSPRSPRERRIIGRALAALAVGCGLAYGSWAAWSAWRCSALRARAEDALGHSRWARAEADLARLAWYRPRDPEVIRLRLRAALGRGDREAMIRLLADVPDSDPGAADARLTRSRFLMQAFRLREAEADLRSALRLQPGLLEARMQLITICGILRRADDFDREAWALYENGGHSLEALRLLAQSGPAIPYGMLKSHVDEGLILEGCLAADPADPHVRPALARFYRERGRVEEARRLLEPWLREHPDDRAAADEWLACALEVGDLDPVRAEFEHPSESARGSATYWLLRAEWHHQQGQADRAVECCREAVRLRPQNAEAHFRLGQALRAAGHPDEAAEALGRSEKLADLKAVVGRIPERAPDPALLLRAGTLCAELARKREAHAWLSLAIRHDPRNDEARKALAALRR